MARAVVARALLRFLSDGDPTFVRRGDRSDDRPVLFALLVLVATPEPTSSAYTSATAQRTLKVSPLAELRPERKAFLKQKLALDQGSLVRMSQRAESLEKRYLEVIEDGDAKTAVEAWADVAEIYLHFAEQIRSLGRELEPMARGPEARAREAIESGLSEAREHHVRGRARARLQAFLRRMPAK
jgi:hypothetical protein